MTNHETNLARVTALRSGRWITGDSFRQAAVDHIEDVLTRHAPQVRPLSKVAHCLPCWGLLFPCPDYASALALLDALDGGTDG